MENNKTGDSNSKVSSPKEQLLRMHACGQTFSLFAHDSKCHCDSFQDVPSLENEKCLTWRDHECADRGDAGPKKFVHALLDWKGSKVNKRRQECLAATGNFHQWSMLLLNKCAMIILVITLKNIHPSRTTHNVHKWCQMCNVSHAIAVWKCNFSI